MYELEEEKEILKLHTMSEEDAIGWLYDRSVFTNRRESLSDCAWRLRCHVFTEDIEKFYAYLFGSEGIDLHRCAMNWWGLMSEPIHWIQVALLAKIKNRKK
jgi:hypothetical protein